MGNSSSKDRGNTPSRPSNPHHPNSQVHSDTAGSTSQLQQHQSSPSDRLAAQIYISRGAVTRGSRPDFSFLALARDRASNNEDQTPERPRETKVEREARRTERDRQVRQKEREHSLREESVDGGFLVTLGTYTGPEDFSKSVVRQLQIERRLAPFWRGLNDHSDSWTEAQLVAAARGLPIPAADEVPPEIAQSGLHGRGPLDINVPSLAGPMMSRSQSAQSDTSANLSASHPAFSNSRSESPLNPTSASALFRGRAKTLASLATGSKSSDAAPQEVQLPKDPYVNGLPLEAYLYREPLECPICFLYYPPYLNKTRCCDQPICSECFVQIKRPDPHPPEHEQPGQQRPPEEEADTLVSEVAACPFCVTPEFGVTYDSPQFRRGLAYPSQSNGHPLNSLRNPISAMSSSTSLTSTANRRRAMSLSANAPQVITTDKVRPDWAKKLADARMHALRRSVAATALHNAAYVLGGDAQYRSGMGFGRRRRMVDASPGESGTGTPREDGNTDTPSRSGRRTRVDDIEELMMMEAIRLSLAAEEDRKRREEKEARKDLKKKTKDAKKEAKQAEKHAKRHGSGNTGLYPVGTNDSTSTWGSVGMSRSMSNLGTQSAIPEEQIQGKGKAPLHTPSFATQQIDTTPISSTSATTSAVEDPQRHLEASRANINPVPSQPISMPTGRSAHFRQLSEASSVASSFGDSAPGSFSAGIDSNIPSASGSRVDVSATNNPSPAASESMFNFRSLAAMVGKEDDKLRDGGEHIEHLVPPATTAESSSSPDESPAISDEKLLTPSAALHINDSPATRSRGDSGESSSSAPPPVYAEHAPSSSPSPSPGVDSNAPGDAAPSEPYQDDSITPAAPLNIAHEVVDSKGYDNMNLLDHGHVHEATQ